MRQSLFSNKDLSEKETLAQVLSYQLYENSKNIFPYRTPSVAASAISNFKPNLYLFNLANVICIFSSFDQYKTTITCHNASYIQ